jgi:hypothetical protein
MKVDDGIDELQQIRAILEPAIKAHERACDKERQLHEERLAANEKLRKTYKELRKQFKHLNRASYEELFQSEDRRLTLDQFTREARLAEIKRPNAGRQLLNGLEATARILKAGPSPWKLKED